MRADVFLTLFARANSGNHPQSKHTRGVCALWLAYSRSLHGTSSALSIPVRCTCGPQVSSLADVHNRKSQAVCIGEAANTYTCGKGEIVQLWLQRPAQLEADRGYLISLMI